MKNAPRSRRSYAEYVSKERLEHCRRRIARHLQAHLLRIGRVWVTSDSVFFFSSRRRHTRLQGDWSSDVCSSDLTGFRHSKSPNIPSRHAISATFMRCNFDGDERWMFQDVHEGGPAYVGGLRPGDRKSVV